MRAVTAMNAIRIAVLLSFVRTNVPLRPLLGISPSKQNRCSFVHLIVELFDFADMGGKIPHFRLPFCRIGSAPSWRVTLSGRAAAPSEFLMRQTAPEFGHACPFLAHMYTR